MKRPTAIAITKIVEIPNSIKFYRSVCQYKRSKEPVERQAKLLLVKLYLLILTQLKED